MMYVWPQHESEQQDTVPAVTPSPASLLTGVVALIAVPTGQNQQPLTDIRPRRFTYARLMRAVVTHTFYTQNADHQCPGFTVDPTPQTADSLRRLGLLFREEPGGFSVLYDTSHKISGQPGLPVLSFLLYSDNEALTTITDAPDLIGKDSDKVLYCSNAAISGDSTATPRKTLQLEPLPPLGQSLQFPLQLGQWLMVLNSAGETVVCGQGLGKQDQLAAQPKRTRNSSQRMTYQPPAAGLATGTAYVDLGPLPPGRYAIYTQLAAAVVPASAIPTSVGIWLASTAQIPFGFLDLFLTPPAGAAAPSCPLGNAATAANPIDPQSYELSLLGRSTVWRYHIVPRSGTLNDLSIVVVEPENASLTFTSLDPDPSAQYPAGTQSFRSSLPLDLTDAPPQRFSLRGVRGPSGRRAVTLIGELPVASLSSFGLFDKQLCSEIFVYV